MTESMIERLYNLLPAVYRARDSKEGEPLRALLDLIEDEMRLLEEDIEGLYDDWFIETCDDWVIPYIGDLLGVHAVHSLSAGGASMRGYVANTIAYRRRKGTASVLEQVSRDVTGWPAHAVEFFQLLAVTQQLNHLRLDRGRTASVRDANEIELVNGPFERTAHTLDVRRIATRGGKYNIPNIGIFLWRLQSFPLNQAAARKIGDEGYRYTFDPTGIEIPLFNRPQTEDWITHLSEEINVPGPLRRYPLYNELEARRNGNAPQPSYFDPPPPVFAIDIIADGETKARRVPLNDIFICNMAEWQHPPSELEKVITSISDSGFEVDANEGATSDRELFSGGVVEVFSDQENNPGIFAAIEKVERDGPKWVVALDEDISRMATHTNPRVRRITVSVDPERGRLTVLKAVSHHSVLVSYSYGFSGDVGAGPYDRTSSIRQILEGEVDWQIGVRKEALEGDKACNTVQEALNKWSNPEDGGVSGMYIRWEKIPGEDSGKLMEILVQKFAIDWLKTAKIEKVDNGKTVRVSAEKNYLSLKLNDEKTEAILETDDGRTDTFKVKLKSGELIVCSGIKVGLIVVMDSRTYKENLKVTIPKGCKLLIIAADWPEPMSTGQFMARDLRPHLQGDIEVEVPEETPPDSESDLGELVMNGLLIEGQLSVLAGNLRLQVAQTTLVPGFGGIKIKDGYIFCWDEIPGMDNGKLIEFLAGKFDLDWIKNAEIEKIDVGKTIKAYTEEYSLSLRLNDKKTEVNLQIDDGRTDKFIAKTESGNINVYREASSVELTIDRSICGPIDIDGRSSRLVLKESIIDDADIANEAIAAEDAAAQIDRCTVLGISNLRRLEASNSIFSEKVTVKQRQNGCVRFSYIPYGLHSPRRFHCQPDMAIVAEKEEFGGELSDKERKAVEIRLIPAFTSVHYGDPGYVQLSFASAKEIRTGAEDGSEMGVFGILEQPQREANLRAALEEYMRFGLEAGIFYVT